MCPGNGYNKYKGKFDQGWDTLREETLARQITLGTVPPNTTLAPMPEMARASTTFTPEEQRVLAREMEVYAAMAEHADCEIGQLIQAIEDLGELDDALVVWVAGDNGGSPFGGPIGSFNQLALFNGVPETMENLLQHIDDLGGPKASGHAHAMGPGELHADGGRAGPCHLFLDTQRDGDPLAQGESRPRVKFARNFNMSSTWLRRRWRPRARRSQRS